MTAENVYQIALHLPEKEMEKLYDMLGKKLSPEFTLPKINKDKTVLLDQEAIQYLLKNVFRQPKVV